MSDCEHRRFLKNIVPVKTGDFRFDCPWCAPRPEDKKCAHDSEPFWVLDREILKAKVNYPICPFCQRPEDKKCEHDKGTQWDSLRTKYPNWVEKTSFPTCPFCRPEVKEEEVHIGYCSCHTKEQTTVEKLAEKMKYNSGAFDDGQWERLAKVAIEFVKELVSKRVWDDHARQELLNILES